MSHTCHAEGCDVRVPAAMFMHRAHWYMVPKKLRDQLWDAYVPGQELSKDPSAEYLIVAERCICAVAVKEGKITQDEADDRLALVEQTAAFTADAMQRMGGDFSVGSIAGAILDVVEEQDP